MSVNRDLRLPTITEPAAFLDEVEQASKRFDVASPAPGEGSETLRVREGQPVLVA